MAYNTKRAISPIIATILLIVMTVSIAAFTFIWMQGFMTNVQQQAEQQASTMQQPVFGISYAVFNPPDSANVTFVVVNQGTIPVDLSQATFTLEEYSRAGNSLENTYILSGSSISCITGNSTVTAGEQSTCYVNFNRSVTLSTNYYVFSITYKGVRQAYTIR